MPTLKMINFDKIGLPIVQLKINKVLTYFLIDTGAIRTNINPNILPSLNEEQKRLSTRHNAVGFGGIVECLKVKCPFIFIGVVVDYIIVSDSCTNIAQCSTLNVSGIIGQDILHQFKSVVFDYTRQTISFNLK